MNRAECPNCKKKLMWDWLRDVYVVVENSKAMVQCRAVPIENPLKEVQVDAHICTCGKIIGVSIVDEDGEMVYNHPMLDGINWEEDGNAWDDNMGPITPIEELSKLGE